MSTTELSHAYYPPATAQGLSFIGFNALTGDREGWEAAVGEPLRAAGHGTLFWNLRGQAGSPAPADRPLDVDLVVSDALSLYHAVRPPRPVPVGLSIGGLFAARAVLAGLPAQGLVLLNTLRAPGPRLEWINAAVYRAALTGGPALLRDLYSPLLFGDAWLRDNRGSCLSGADYAPLAADSATARLLGDSRNADWDLPYEQLTLPVLVVTGERDSVFRVPADIDRLYARLPKARRVDWPEVGHLITALSLKSC